MKWAYRFIITSLLVWGIFTIAMSTHTKQKECAVELNTELTECIVNGKVFTIIESY